MTKAISNKKKISINDDINSVRCPKFLANLELFRKPASSSMKEVGIREKEIDYIGVKRKVLEYTYDEAKEITDSIVEKIAKIRFTLANAYPYIFDAICGLLTNEAAISEKHKKRILNFDDIEESIFLMLDIPFGEFLDWALDGEIEQKDRLIENLNNLADASPKELQKYIPISQKYCAKVAPVQIILIKKNEEEIPASKLKSLKNLTIRKTNKGTPDEKTIRLQYEKLPIERIQIHTLKSLFQDLTVKEYGINWFENLKALQSKIVAYHQEYKKEVSLYLEKLLKELKEIPSDEKKEKYEALKSVVERYPSPMILRRTYFYIKMHLSSNSHAKKINVDLINFFTHVDPSYLRKGKSGKKYTIGGENRALAFLNLAYNFFIALENKYNYSGNHLKHLKIKSRATP